MQKTTILTLLTLTLLTFTACEVKVTDPHTQTGTGTENTETGAEAVVRTCTIEELDTCMQQVKSMKTDLTKLLQADSKCNSELTILKIKVENNNQEDTHLNNILKNYVTTTTQKEFPFDKCGSVGSFANEDWFTDFQTALESEIIPFSKLGRNLATDDLTGGCFSSEGQMAFFMGAEAKTTLTGIEQTDNTEDTFDTEDVFEFHLLKYNLTTKKIEKVIMASNLCTDENCPAVYDQRTGASIPMRGISKEQECKYNYYFDQNILVKEECVNK